MIRLDDVTKRYPDGTVAVGGLSLEVQTGTVTALVGSSGCGKTTTLRMINRMVEPTSGTIEVEGRDVTTVPVTELRRSIGYVIQQAGLFPHRTVLDNIVTVPRLLGWSKQECRRRALELLELVGLDPKLAGRYPAQLSGGQQQRIGVARALAADPPVLLMDEPFGAVDPVQRGQLQVEFLRLQRALHKTVVFVTHDIDEALTVAEHVVVMAEGGRVAQRGTPVELLSSPADEFVAGFLGADRHLRLLSLRPASTVPFRPVDSSVAGWALVLDHDRRPVEWRSPSGPSVPVESVGPDGSARAALDAVVASPTNVAVLVDGAGVATGLVTLAELSGSLS